MRSAAEIVQSLKGVKGGNGKWTALCPAHQDTKHSLSIGEGASGAVLLNCFAGCTFEQILDALGVEPKDVLPPKAGEPLQTYTYHLADGRPVTQVRRYPPKEFRQFHLASTGEWTAGVPAGIPRVLYRLPHLVGQETAWVVEGEKDANRLARAGLAATTKAGGASNWLTAYTDQLKAAGVKRAILIPDHDEPGVIYMRRVAVALEGAGIDCLTLTLPNCPPKGDVSDWLQTHTIEDLLALTAVPTGAPLLTPTVFEAIAGGYRLSLPHGVITFDLTRLRRQSGELLAELTVRTALPGARTVGGVLSSGDFNCSAIQTRTSRAKHLKERSRFDADWEAWLTELVLKATERERQGAPAEILTDVDPATDEASLHVLAFQLPRANPAILFGDGGSGKSLVALHVAGTLALAGELVLYCDWEASAPEHRRRLNRLFPETPQPPILYARCERPLVDEAERLRRLIDQHGITYLVCDSIGYGVDGAPEAAESALDYFRALRSFGTIGSLLLAHVTKSEDGDKRPFGSAFYHNSARATWHLKRSNPDDLDDLHLLCTQRKVNDGRLAAPFVLTIDFQPERILIRRGSILARDEFADKLDLTQHILALLAKGQLSRPELRSALPDAKTDTIKHTLERIVKRGQVVRFVDVTGEDRYGLRAKSE